MIQLDERLGAIASLVLDQIREIETPAAADIGCDHGFLTAYLLESCPRLFMIASDVSAPSLEKARKLLSAGKYENRAKLAVADGLAAIDRPVHAVVIAGMGTQTILGILREGKDKIGDSALIVQSNVDLPVLRRGLAQMGYAVRREVYTQAAGRHYVTLLARAGESRTLGDREALLGSAADGMTDAGQRAYFSWQRGVRVREMRQVARLNGGHVEKRMAQNSEELSWIAEAMGMNVCTVNELERLVGQIAPYELAEEWDNVGLLLGRRSAQVTRVLVALDLTQNVIAEAKNLGAQAIVTHHPIMFSARKRVTDDDCEGRLMLSLAEAGIAHIAAHTNLDAAKGGVNDTLMALMGAENIAGEGCVRVGDLAPGTTLEALARRAEKKLHAQVRIYGAADTPVHKLGCCSGAGSGEIAEAVAQGADAFITGEVKHHLALEAMEMGCVLIEAGHYETENPVCEVLADALQNAADELKYNVTVFCSKGNPFGH